MTNLNEVSRDTLKGGFIHRLVRQARLNEFFIQFVGEDAQDEIAAPGGALTLDVEVQVTDTTGIQSTFADQEIPERPAVKEVTVRITGGTAPNASLSAGTGSKGTVQAGGSEFVLPLVKGRGKVRVTVTGTGDVDLDKIDSGGSGYTIDDLVKAIFS